MKRLNCKKLNRIFNVNGPDFIEVSDILDHKETAISGSKKDQNPKFTRQYKKKQTILEVKNDSGLVYKKKEHKTKQNINLDAHIDYIIEGLIKEQKEEMRLVYNDYETIRSHFLEWMEQLDAELGDRLIT